MKPSVLSTLQFAAVLVFYVRAHNTERFWFAEVFVSRVVFRVSVPLFGTCEEDKDCAGSGTECLASYCVCAEGHHPQDGICSEWTFHQAAITREYPILLSFNMSKLCAIFDTFPSDWPSVSWPIWTHSDEIQHDLGKQNWIHIPSYWAFVPSSRWPRQAFFERWQNHLHHLELMHGSDSDAYLSSLQESLAHAFSLNARMKVSLWWTPSAWPFMTPVTVFNTVKMAVTSRIAHQRRRKVQYLSSVSCFGGKGFF